MPRTVDRIHPIAILDSQVEQVQELNRIVQLGDATLTSQDGSHTLHVPDVLYHLLLRILASAAEGKPLTYVDHKQEFTTQQAAEYLGMSRQFLVNILEAGEIPFHRVGKHRRVLFSDLNQYREQRDQARHQAIGQIARAAVENGSYDEF